MDNSNQNYTTKKKDTYSVKIVIAILLLILLFLSELYFMINDPTNYIVLIILTVVALADVYVLAASVIQKNYQREQEHYEQYDNLFKSEKASYLILRKSFDEIEERLERIEGSSGIPTEEIINAQKSIAKVTINRNKENSDALMNSNDKIYEQLFSLEDAIAVSNEALLEKHKVLIDNSNKDIMMKQQEIIAKLREVELSIKNEVLSGMSKISMGTPVAHINPMPQPEAVSYETDSFDVGESEPLFAEESMTEEPIAEEPMPAEPEVSEEPEMDFAMDESADEPALGFADEAEAAGETDEPLEMFQKSLANQENEENAKTAEEESVAESAVETPSDPNRVMTPEEIAALIAGTNEVEEPIIEDSIAEETPSETETAGSGIDTSDPNRMMTPDEIAALFANA